jgi:hypothetical protein
MGWSSLFLRRAPYPWLYEQTRRFVPDYWQNLLRKFDSPILVAAIMLFNGNPVADLRGRTRIWNKVEAMRRA